MQLSSSVALYLGLDITILCKNFENQVFADSKPSLHGNQARVWLFACSEEMLYQDEKTMTIVLC